MSHVIRAADDGELLNSNQFHYTKDSLGRPVLNVTASGEGNGDFMADGSAAFVKADTQAEYVPLSVGTPTANNHAVTKEYSDGKTNALQASVILKSGGKMTGKLKITAATTEADDVVDKEYVDAIIPAYTTADDGKVLGVVNGALAWVTK